MARSASTVSSVANKHGVAAPACPAVDKDLNSDSCREQRGLRLVPAVEVATEIRTPLKVADTAFSHGRSAVAWQAALEGPALLAAENPSSTGIVATTSNSFLREWHLARDEERLAALEAEQEQVMQLELMQWCTAIAPTLSRIEHPMLNRDTNDAAPTKPLNESSHIRDADGRLANDAPPKSDSLQFDLSL